uniref:OTU domain-containing protein n=1 Tax=Panagrolaimus sp. PS1159 TaxID=55785 RepID=A0AC35G0W5_9BILA
MNPPSEVQIQRCLTILGLPAKLAANSPLLPTRNTTYDSDYLEISDCEGDGNCGYRAISKLLTGREDFHWRIRHKTYEHILKHGVDITGMLKRDVELFKNVMIL